jgi:hypothetical protein
MRWLHENTDKQHRCPKCHCVMPWRYRPVRKWLFGDMEGLTELLYRDGLRWLWRKWKRIDILLPRRCRECMDVIAVPTWLARILRIKES